MTYTTIETLHQIKYLQPFAMNILLFRSGLGLMSNGTGPVEIDDDMCPLLNTCHYLTGSNASSALDLNQVLIIHTSFFIILFYEPNYDF